MSFEWPWALAALVAIPLLLELWWLLRRRRRRTTVRVASVAIVRAAAGRRRWTRFIPATLLVLGLAVLGVGAARPQATLPLPSNAMTIMLALDVSGSMCATDVAPNRLTVATQAAADFIKANHGTARIGLVTFANYASVDVKPTDDVDELLDALDKVTTGRGTAIGQAILTSLDALSEYDPSIPGTSAAAQNDGDPATFRNDAIVVLTDGANPRGIEPQDAAQLAADRDIQVYTIGFGTTSASQLVCSSSQTGDELFGPGGFGSQGGFGSGGFGGDGANNPLQIDEETLQSVADTTGGKYYRAEDASQLNEALRDLPNNLTLVTEKVDLSAWLAAGGGLLIALAVALSLWWARVRPVKPPQPASGSAS